ncbi:MAG: tetratricopeptide repeat protein [Planctomycetes bacterium]|nr:tetratricopeptide repeat protein [Planctomycetota bacterium]
MAMSTTDESLRRRRHLLACLVIVLAGLAVYSDTLHSSFHFDDHPNIVNNPLIRDLSNIPRFFQNNGHTFPSRGLVTTSFAINYYFSGLSVESYHWVNISIHLLNGILAYFFVVILFNQYITRGRGSGLVNDISRVHILALFAALLFLTNPFQTHEVTYVYQRNGLMASFFYLSSLILFIKAISGPRVRVYLYAMSILSFLCAVWSKEMACTAPVIMFLYYQCFIAKEWRSPGKGLSLIFPHALVWAVSFYLGVVRNIPLERITEWTFWEYLLTQSNVLIEYIKLLLLPVPGRLNIDYAFPLTGTLWEFPTMLSAAIVIAMLTVAFSLLEREKLLSFCILWFFVILAPTSGLVPVRDIMVCYRLYLPGMGFYILLVVGIHSLFRHLAATRGYGAGWLWRAELAVFVGIIVFYSACAYERNKVFLTGISLWEDAVKKSPYKIRPHYGLGRAYQERGLETKAHQQYLMCKELYLKTPDIRNVVEVKSCSEACNNLAAIHMNAGRYEVAIGILKDAVQVYPKNLQAHVNLGGAYIHTGRLEDAEAAYKQAVLIDSNYSRGHAGLGLVYEKKGMTDEAVRAYTNALEADPSNAAMWMRLGELWLNDKKDPGKALHCFQEVKKYSTDQGTLQKANQIIEAIKERGAVESPLR